MTAERELVLLLHGSAGTGAVWRGLCSKLQPLFRCLSPDLIGYGGSDPWLEAVPFDLDAEMEAIDPLLPCCGDRYHIVGYSYGGVLALHLALSNPVRVHSLTMIEPVFFSALRYAGDWGAYRRFIQAHDDFLKELVNEDPEAAMGNFIDFWAGPGTWRYLAPGARADLLKLIPKTRLDWQAAFAADPGRERLAVLGPRTLLVRGDRSLEPMQRLVDATHELMPGSRRVVVEGANHMLPVTHMAEIARLLLSHLHADAERRLR